MKILCRSCGEWKKPRARELCAACYQAAWLRGELPSKEEAYRLSWIRRRKAKTIVCEETGCWLWQGLTEFGYGWTSWHSKSEFLHRASYLAHGGTLESGKQVRHLCANKTCWNPDHLAKGTQADNEQDKRNQGRFAYNQGEGRYNSKLTEDDVQGMRIRANRGETHQSIADRYDYARPNVGKIVNRQIWRHVA